SASANKTVFIRKNSPLFFYHPEGSNAPRFRIEKVGDSFNLVGREGKINEDQIKSELETDLEKFSSTVLIRPIVQDTILPTVAYIGGPAELAYFEQLAELYPLFELEKPFVIERFHSRLIEPKIAALLETLKITPKQLATDPHSLKQL